MEGSAFFSPPSWLRVDNSIAVHLVPSLVGVDMGELLTAQKEKVGRAMLQYHRMNYIHETAHNMVCECHHFRIHTSVPLSVVALPAGF